MYYRPSFIHSELRFGPPADHSVRVGLIHAIEELGDQQGLDDTRFQQGAGREGKRYSKFLKNNTAHIDDVHDAEEIVRAMTALLDRFQPDLEAVGKMLPGFVSKLQ